MGRAKSTPRISAPSAPPVGIISIDIGGSPAGKATHPPCKAGDTASSVSDAYTTRTARERGRTVRQRLVTLACNCSDYAANDRSDSSPMMQGVAYLARDLKFESK